MAHKTLINGTAYEIDDGKAMVDGTVYEIDHGVANVGGTAYEVNFGLNLEVPEGMYLTFSSANPFTIAVNNQTKYWDGALYYSTNAAEWSEWDGTTAIASATDNGEQRLYMCGAGNSVISNYSGKWIIDGNNIKCNGNIECLLDYEMVANGIHPTMADSCYSNMFRDCTALTTAPSLPTMTLTTECYGTMFKGCTSLITAPSLPATDLTSAIHCYYSMFEGCTSLITAPSLPATTLESHCYYLMFKGCTSLITAPSLPATTLSDSCYSHMFDGCTALTTIPRLSAPQFATYCYYYMFNGCKKIKLSATQTGTYTTEYRIPTSGTAANVGNALMYMFDNTGGTFTRTPNRNTTYYLDSSNTIV